MTSALQLFGSVTYWMFWDHGYQALATLDSTDLAKLATPARAINGADRAAGDVVVISITTLLLILILLVLILK